MQKKDEELLRMFSEWQSGRFTDFAEVQFNGDLESVTDHYVIVTNMPVDTQPLSDLAPEEKGRAKMALHAFTHIGIKHIPNNNGGFTTVAGPCWQLGSGLWLAMPFPAKEMAQEFADKVIDLPGVYVVPVSELLKSIHHIPKPKK